MFEHFHFQRKTLFLRTFVLCECAALQTQSVHFSGIHISHWNSLADIRIRRYDARPRLRLMAESCHHKYEPGSPKKMNNNFSVPGPLHKREKRRPANESFWFTLAMANLRDNLSRLTVNSHHISQQEQFMRDKNS